MSSSLPAAAPPPETPTDQVEHMMVAIIDLVFYDPDQAQRDADSSQPQPLRIYDPVTCVLATLPYPRLPHIVPPRKMWLEPVYVGGIISHLMVGIPCVPPRFPTLRPEGRALPPHIFFINLRTEDKGIWAILGQANIPKVVFDADIVPALLRNQHGITLRGALGLKQLWNRVEEVAGESLQTAACNIKGVVKYLSEREKPQWEGCLSETEWLCNPSQGGRLERYDKWPLPKCLRMYGSFVVQSMQAHEEHSRRLLSAPIRDQYRHPLVAAEAAVTAWLRRQEEQENQDR